MGSLSIVLRLPHLERLDMIGEGFRLGRQLLGAVGAEVVRLTFELADSPPMHRISRSLASSFVLPRESVPRFAQRFKLTEYSFTRTWGAAYLADRTGEN